MSAFWQGFERANDVAIEVMGEPVVVSGIEVMGIVDPVFREEAAPAGGRKTILDASVLLAGSVEIADAMPVEIRGAVGKVVSWDELGPSGHRTVRVGPFNRWSGEIPGV